MLETEGVTKIPNEQMREIEKMKETQKPQNAKEALTLEFAFLLFKAINRAGMMPYHATDFVCPKCGTSLKELANADKEK